MYTYIYTHMFSIHHLIIGVPKFHQYPHIASIFPNFVYLKQWPLMPLLSGTWTSVTPSLDPL